jgi:hypothetical protein
MNVEWSRAAVKRVFLLLLTALLAAGCTVKTTVEVTATTPASVIHLYVTVKEIWLTTQTDATPSSGQWVRKVLSDPVTLDLATLNGGATTAFDSLEMDAGTYAQIRLVLAGVEEDLTKSARTLGLNWNDAVQYLDASGTSHLVPLELPYPGGSLLSAISIKLGGSSLLKASASSDETGSVIFDIDALHGLVILDDDGDRRALLNPGLQAADASKAGTITGTLDLSGIATGIDGIVVSAEVVDADNTRHSIVKSTRPRSDGSFTLYPLPAEDSDQGSYDIVVHGPGVSTLLVTGVPVQAGQSTSLQASSIPLPAAASFLANTNSTVYGGTRAEFYQTLPTDSKPYLIDSASVNPFGVGFDADLALSTGPLVHGVYNGGSAISFSTANPQEGLARYQLATDSHWRARSAFQTVTGNSAGSGTTQSIGLLQPALPANASAGSISGTIFFGTARRYDSLQVIVSRGGQIVDTLNLGSIGANSAINFTIAGVPALTADAVYDLSVRAWNSANPGDTLVRAAFTSQVDLRQGSVSNLSLQL